MELTLRAGCWIKFCKWLAEVKCPYNYYNLFYLPLNYITKVISSALITIFLRESSVEFIDLL